MMIALLVSNRHPYQVSSSQPVYTLHCNTQIPNGIKARTKTETKAEKRDTNVKQSVLQTHNDSEHHI